MLNKKVSLLILSMLTLAACSQNGPTSATTANTSENSPSVETGDKKATGDGEPITLRYVRGSGVSEGEQKMLDLFTEQNPNIKIQIEQAKGGGLGDVMEKIAALQAAGTPADITWVQDVIPFGKDELLLDLTPYMKSDPVLSLAKIPKNSLPGLQYKEAQLGLPRAENPIVIYVNKDLLAKNGIDMPKNDWTWDDYREIAKKVTKPSDSEYGVAYGPFNINSIASALGVSNGSAANLNFMDADNKQSTLTTPEARRDIEWLADFSRVDGSRATWEKTEKEGIEWLAGKVAFEVHGVWEGKNMKEKAKFNWDVLPLPKGQAKQIGINVATGIGVLKASKYPEEAVKFLSFMHTMEAQKLMMLNGDFPLTEDEELKQVLLETPIWKGTNINAVTAVEMMAGGPIVGSDQYINWWDGETLDAFREGKDLNKAIFDQAQHYNEVAPKLREELGLD
ncbi:sugar ABC transporter substrate-binding protein [Paenibacillus pasadenensis]|uniref:ABC transporter substrate-binding protein n=1 Tax=Paenibacillus pasadenensis TaxID=217090 RepID=UPI00203EC7AB|nr:sugar ABC transporter substrate-binding protein [Paenibacillus pasadenensis]MCM3749047.1 sugar ABC transporter substrate-binding protein [Paenibacillus pasadenensis]